LGRFAPHLYRLLASAKNALGNIASLSGALSRYFCSGGHYQTRGFTFSTEILKNFAALR
jgi:hypothetical protein